jgi:hypothetical protein
MHHLSQLVWAPIICSFKSVFHSLSWFFVVSSVSLYAGLGGFVACRALSQRNNDPTKASRPWDVVSIFSGAKPHLFIIAKCFALCIFSQPIFLFK